MKQKILDALENIEQTRNVRILLAVESGSRAWGFASPDSDYDVRFIYVRCREAYLRLEKARDVIELPLDDALDINGWKENHSNTVGFDADRIPEQPLCRTLQADHGAVFLFKKRPPAAGSPSARRTAWAAACRAAGSTGTQGPAAGHKNMNDPAHYPAY